MADEPNKTSSVAWIVLLLALLAHFAGGVQPVGPAPIPTAGFRVLIIEETADRGKLTIDQLNQLTAIGPGSVLAYLRANCVKSQDDPGYKILDKDDDPSRLGEPWIEAWKNKGTALPWLLASNGKTGFSGPLPATAAETIKILEKYAK